MKNKNIFYIIYISLIIFSLTILLILVILGNKTRKGYIEIDKTYTKTYSNIFQYNMRIKYYDNIFRNSDIYGVYIDANEIINNNKFVKKIDMQNGGSPFGSLISDKIINNKKIDNISYKLKLKKMFILYIIIFHIAILLMYYLTCLYINYKIQISSHIYKYIRIYTTIYNKYNIKTIYIIFIISLGIFVRIFWAYQQDRLYWDEYHGIAFLNKGIWSNMLIAHDTIKNYINKKGYDILKDWTIDDSSIKDCFDDIKRLYKNTNDPFISNLYYTLLRLAFIGREAVSIKNIIITGTILNCIFFIISSIFLYKMLKLIFENKNDYILFSLLIMSLSPISISFSMFLRPYQIQETFFIVITYLVINTIYNSKYSVINFVITTIIAGIGYLTLYSSMLFVLILSAMLFINYIEHFKNINKFDIFTPLIKIDSYKTILYYATSFILAMFVSKLLYSSFFLAFYNTNNRSANTLKFSGKIFSFINELSFNGLFILLFIFMAIYLFYLIINNKTLYIAIERDKIKLLIFIIIIGLLYAILSDFTSPYKIERYTATSYILILFIFPLVFSIIKNNKTKYIIFIIISMIYINNITNSKRFRYFEKIDKGKYVLNENIPVYAYKTFFTHLGYPYEYMNTNLYYTYIDRENDINIMTNDNKFYLLINNKTKYILTNNILKDYKSQYLNKMGNGNNTTSVFKLEKK